MSFPQTVNVADFQTEIGRDRWHFVGYRHAPRPCLPARHGMRLPMTPHVAGLHLLPPACWSARSVACLASRGRIHHPDFDLHIRCRYPHSRNRQRPDQHPRGSYRRNAAALAHGSLPLAILAGLSGAADGHRLWCRCDNRRPSGRFGTDQCLAPDAGRHPGGVSRQALVKK